MSCGKFAVSNKEPNVDFHVEALNGVEFTGRQSNQINRLPPLNYFLTDTGVMVAFFTVALINSSELVSDHRRTNRTSPGQLHHLCIEKCS